MKFDIRHPVALIAFMTLFASGFAVTRFRPWEPDLIEPQGYHLARVEQFGQRPEPASRYRLQLSSAVYARLDDGRIGTWRMRDYPAVILNQPICVFAQKRPRNAMLILRPTRMERCVTGPVTVAEGVWAGPAPEFTRPAD